MSYKLKHIELFAGCGGMSLGLESAGYELYFANELSPMASETFSFNLLGENLQNQEPQKTLWLSSQFPKDQLRSRLKENPIEAIGGRYSDLNSESDFEDKLIVGDVNGLLNFLVKNRRISKKIEQLNIDLMSGGPPCQSFSLAGKRVQGDKKNTLPLSFAKVAGLLKPKVILLENVKGIASPFTIGEKKYYAWLEVSKAFALEGYVPICMMVNSKYFGVAQNRPRFILIAFRLNIFKNIVTSSKVKRDILSKSLHFYNKVQSSLTTVGLQDLDVHDIETNIDLFDGDIFPSVLTKDQFISASDAISDISNINLSYIMSNIASPYPSRLNRLFSQKIDSGEKLNNHEPRNHNFYVKARFRIYQVLNEMDNTMKRTALAILTGKEDVPAEEVNALLKELSKHELFFKTGDMEYHTETKDLEKIKRLLNSIPSKKHSQRALREFEPAPAQLTIPDDLCHYSMEQLRTLTVREMARFQSFPDWFEFRSKVTTGGKLRKVEAPQYTQVGNAVPPLLARELGLTLRKVLSTSDDKEK